MPVLSQTTLDLLRTAVRGRVWLPADTGFDHARLPWNRAVEQPTCAVVEAADAEDIARLLRFASAHGVPVAPQPSGHGATGRTAGGILLRTARLDSVEIDPSALTARIGAGVRSGDLQRAAAGHGLTALPGSSPEVTVTGAALGGGLSWFGRAFGWISDSIRAAEIVLADGTVRRAELLTRLDDDVLDALLSAPIAPLMTVQVRHLGGALARPSDSPHGPLAEPYAVYLFGVPRSPDDADSISIRQAELAAALPVSGRKPISFLNPSEQLSDALPAASLQRLRRLKLRYDPHGIIRGNFRLPG